MLKNVRILKEKNVRKSHITDISEVIYECLMMIKINIKRGHRTAINYQQISRHCLLISGKFYLGKISKCANHISNVK